MTKLPRLEPATSRGWPLQRTLAVLISVVLTLLIGTFGTAAYREMRQASIERASRRLEEVAVQLATSSATSSGTRLATLRRLAATPQARAAVTAASTSGTAAMAALLASERTVGDSTLLGWEVTTASGTPVLEGSRSRTPIDSAMLARVRATTVEVDAPQRSDLFVVDDRIRVWNTVPISAGGRVVGVLAEHRQLANNPRAAAAVHQLIGDNVAVLIASASGQWASITGQPIQPRFQLGDRGRKAGLRSDDGGIPHYVASAEVPGTPYLFVLAEPVSSVLQRPREFLRFLLAMGLALVALGGAAAWAIGRHLTQPLRDITRTAEALAGGDYARRVAVRGGRELAQLSATFNGMASAIDQARAELEMRNTALVRANEAKSRFLAMMSHELRTPLNAIGGYTDLLELGVRGPVTTAQAADLRRIRHNRDHLLAIITDILNFARADAGQLTLSLTDVHVADVIADTITSLGHQFEANGVRLVVEPSSEALAVRGDRTKLQQILLNLLTNALRFTETGGEVRIGASPSGQLVRIDVHDTGIGIAPEQLSAIFQPFVQVNSGLTREVGGTGLGLAIARDLASAMGGTLDVRSTVGVGSTFSVVLPRAGAAASTASAPVAAAAATGTQ